LANYCVVIAAGPPQYALLDPSNPSGGLQLQYLGENSCVTGGGIINYKLVVKMPCSDEYLDPPGFVNVTQLDVCTTLAIWKGSANCPVGQPPVGCGLRTGNVSFDLSELRVPHNSTDFYSPADALGNYVELNVCNVTSGLGTCVGMEAGVCMEWGGQPVAALGSWKNAAWSLLDPTNPEKGVQALLTGGDYCAGTEIPRTTLIQFSCVPDVFDKVTWSTPSVPSQYGCQNVVTLPTRYGCPKTAIGVNNDIYDV